MKAEDDRVTMLSELLHKVVREHFQMEANKFTSIAILEWLPPSERQLKRYRTRTGNTMKKQRVRFQTAHILADREGVPKMEAHHSIAISPIEKNRVFYVITDFKLKNMGEVMRYKFRYAGDLEFTFVSSKMLRVR